MNFVDILIWAILLFFLVKGFIKGLVKEACSLIGLLAGGWAAFKYHLYLAEAIRPFIHLPQSIASILSFIFIFILMGILFYLLGHLLTMVCKVMLLGGINRIGGVLFGFLEGAFLLCMVLYFCSAGPVPEKTKAWLSRSRSARVFIATGGEIVTGWEKTSARRHSAGKAD
ncbi:MAG TPA: CvpA family protein [Geobacteraceae bacterium]|nr:CvpA family protein [Geobacteraceae bacterium]